FVPIKGAQVVAVSTAAPNTPVVGVLSDVQAGGPGGGFTIVGLPPGSYHLRLEPPGGGTNPVHEGDTPFTRFHPPFPPPPPGRPPRVIRGAGRVGGGRTGRGGSPPPGPRPRR